MVYPYGPWIYPDERYYYGWYDNPAVKTDRDIKAELVDRFNTNPFTSDGEITVDVKRNVVILTGAIPSTLGKRVAGDEAWDTAGVVDVSNQLEIRPTG